ncbi:protein of unknown function [Pararobbsia alpina]
MSHYSYCISETMHNGVTIGVTRT